MMLRGGKQVQDNNAVYVAMLTSCWVATMLYKKPCNKI